MSSASSALSCASQPINKNENVEGHRPTLTIKKKADVNRGNLNPMKRIIKRSESQFPLAALARTPADATEKALALKHTQVHAMFSMCFNVWLRNSELAGLCVGQIMRGCNSGGPYLKVLMPSKTNPYISNEPLYSFSLSIVLC
ncbi:hypothetical protein FPV67DRAFT_1450227 [Lyophyllum atratum]|nr:hypothetical protein FPV67DRAFT_1450227 [Lyophyllum atratum]